MTLANQVTLARIAFIPLCIAFLLSGLLGFAALVFLLLSFSDAIDGYIARKFNQVSELGKKIDPLADKILVMVVLIGLVGIGRADPLPVMLICVREFFVASFRSKKNFPASPLAKWKTVAQIIAVLTLMFNLPFAGWVLWLAVILSCITGGTYLWQNQFLIP